MRLTNKKKELKFHCSGRMFQSNRGSHPSPENDHEPDYKYPPSPPFTGLLGIVTDGRKKTHRFRKMLILTYPHRTLRGMQRNSWLLRIHLSAIISRRMTTVNSQSSNAITEL